MADNQQATRVTREGTDDISSPDHPNVVSSDPRNNQVLLMQPIDLAEDLDDGNDALSSPGTVPRNNDLRLSLSERHSPRRLPMRHHTNPLGCSFTWKKDPVDFSGKIELPKGPPTASGGFGFVYLYNLDGQQVGLVHNHNFGGSD